MARLLNLRQHQPFLSSGLPEEARAALVVLQVV